MAWFHGTPDARAVKRSGGFEARTEQRRMVRDPEGLSEARRRALEDGLSVTESSLRLNALDAFIDVMSIPVPVFLSATKATAASYADARRAFDYQGAEPDVFSVECDAVADVVIDAKGETFRGLAWAKIEAGLSGSGWDPGSVKDTLSRNLGTNVDGRIRVSDLGAALWVHGARVVDVKNVVDTHTGRGKRDTVRMVFEPASLRIAGIPEPEDPRP